MTKLSPGAIRDELRTMLTTADADYVMAFVRGRRCVRLSDGTTVRRLAAPGWMELNGTRMYSAAWL